MPYPSLKLKIIIALCLANLTILNIKSTNKYVTYSKEGESK